MFSRLATIAKPHFWKSLWVTPMKFDSIALRSLWDRTAVSGLLFAGHERRQRFIISSIRPFERVEDRQRVEGQPCGHR